MYYYVLIHINTEYYSIFDIQTPAGADQSECDSATVQQSQLQALPAARVSSPRVQGHALPSGIHFIPHWRRVRNSLCFSDGIPRDLTNEFTKRREFEN